LVKNIRVVRAWTYVVWCGRSRGIYLYSSAPSLKYYINHSLTTVGKVNTQDNGRYIIKTRKEVNIGKPKFVYPCSYNY